MARFQRHVFTESFDRVYYLSIWGHLPCWGCWQSFHSHGSLPSLKSCIKNALAAEAFGHLHRTCLVREWQQKTASEDHMLASRRSVRSGSLRWWIQATGGPLSVQTTSGPLSSPWPTQILINKSQLWQHSILIIQSGALSILVYWIRWPRRGRLPAFLHLTASPQPSTLTWQPVPGNGFLATRHGQYPRKSQHKLCIEGYLSRAMRREGKHLLNN